MEFLFDIYMCEEATSLSSLGPCNLTWNPFKVIHKRVLTKLNCEVTRSEVSGYYLGVGST